MNAPNNILLCFDSFKDTLRADEIHILLKSCLINDSFHVIETPMADGGEGSLEFLERHNKFDRHEVKTTDPLGRPIDGYYLFESTSDTAFVELAVASGVERLQLHERNPMHTSTQGTGTIIKEAMDHGAKEIYLFIGSSSTNDAAVGIADALNYTFYNKHGVINTPCGKNLAEINSFEKNESLDHIQFYVVCDVKNPLYGVNGAAYIYASQKGADRNEIQALDHGLKNIANLWHLKFGKRYEELEGAGAAGGIGAGMAAFFDASIISGFDFMAKMSQLEEKIKSVDFIITGEGKFDEQSLFGKIVMNVVILAKKHHKKVIVVCGQCEIQKDRYRDWGIHHIIELCNYGEKGSITKQNSILQFAEAKLELLRTIQ